MIHTDDISKVFFSRRIIALEVELEQVPDPTRRPEPEEKLAISEPNTKCYPGSDLGKTRELDDRLYMAWKNVVYTLCYARAKLEEILEPDRLEPPFLTTWHKPKHKVSYPKQPKMAPKIQTHSSSIWKQNLWIGRKWVKVASKQIELDRVGETENCRRLSRRDETNVAKRMQVGVATFCRGSTAGVHHCWV